MPTTRLKTRQDCEDFVRGLHILATGGGAPAGQIDSGLKAFGRARPAERWIDASELGDDAWTACPFLLGAMPVITSEM